MHKDYLLGILEKYYLNGLIEKARVNIKEKQINISFVSENKDLVGFVTSDKFELENTQFAINDTTRFRKLVSITDGELDLKLNQKDGKAGELYIKDKVYKLEFRLADLELVKQAPEFLDPGYEISFKIDRDFVDIFNKGKKALDTEIVTIESIFVDDKPFLKFNLGGTKGHTHKVNFSIPANFEIPGASLTFKITEMREILDTNKDLKEGIGYVNEDGLIKFEFVSEDDVKSTYLLVAKEE